MKILYGIQGTGNGHISRARMMAKHFSEKNADITYLISGRNPEKLFDMEPFGNYLYRRGLTFSVKNGEISHRQTLRENNPIEFLRDVWQLNLDNYDLIITDFEPVTAWAGKLRGKTVIGLGHQYAFNYDVPTAGETLLARNIMRYFAPGQIKVGMHWSHFNAPIMPPIINPDMQRTPQDKGHILVYLPFEDQNMVTRALKVLTGYRFYQYSPELNDRDEHNIHLRKTCHDGFHQDLSSARAVICNAGFELVSECLHLGLPVLTKPLDGQMEQYSNAQALETLKLGSSCKVITAATIQAWLGDLPASSPSPYPDVADALTDWVLAGQWNTPQLLSDQLWESAVELA